MKSLMNVYDWDDHNRTFLVGIKGQKSCKSYTGWFRLEFSLSINSSRHFLKTVLKEKGWIECNFSLSDKLAK